MRSMRRLTLALLVGALLSVATSDAAAATAAQDLTNVEIAARLDTAPEVVAKWRRRFRLERLDGLKDRSRVGRPRRFPPGAGGAGQSGRVRAPERAWRSDLRVLAR